MPVNYNFKRGHKVPQWSWLAQFPQGVSSPGAANVYDGSRYIYWNLQYGSTGSASTTQIHRYDTWSNGWQYLISPPNSFNGLDFEYDAQRNIMYFLVGNSTTEWRYFNPGIATTPSILGTTAGALASTGALTAILPVAATTGASLDASSDADVPENLTVRGTGDDTQRITGTAAAGTTTTTITDTTAEFHAGLIGSYVRFTSGAQVGEGRVITAVPSATSVTVAAFGGAAAAGNTFVVETPGGVNYGARATIGLAATGGTTNTLVKTGAGWPTNIYRDAEVVIVGGTGVGQRRRIASNTTDTLTFASASASVTASKTGVLAAAPDATTVFMIMPSPDFLYYNSNTTTLYRIEVGSATPTWTAVTGSMPNAPSGGASTFRAPSFAPFAVIAFRGAGTSNVYRYDTGLQTWATLPAIWGSETLNTGADVARMPGRHRFYVSAQSTQRNYLYNPVVGTLEPVTLQPYAAPAAYDGKRSRYIKTADGVEYIYHLRAGGQEFFRIPLEWL